MLTGYLHSEYAASHSEFGKPIFLPASGGWLLARGIGESGLRDAMGCYPLFCCVNWAGLHHDLEILKEQLVAVVLVTDPFGKYSHGLLEACFDNVTRFKEHFIIETGQPLASFVNPSHRRHALRALRDVDVEICPEPLAYLEDWDQMFSVLAARHSIRGLRRFSRAAFQKQLAVPGIVMFRALHNGQTIGLDLWYSQDDCAQAHLAAFSSVGYELRASYATKWRAIEYFTERVTCINLGAGRAANSTDGLSQFKQGWSTGKRPAWLCGRVLQAEIYAKLSPIFATGHGYFPAYREGEF